LLFQIKEPSYPATFVKAETTNGTHHLQIGDADVEGLIDVGVPHQPNICDVKCPQVTL